MYNGKLLKRGQVCQVLDVENARMKLTAVEMGGPFWCGFRDWTITATDSTGKCIKTLPWKNVPDRYVKKCASCRSRVYPEIELGKRLPSRFCFECSEKINQDWSDNVMEVSICDSGPLVGGRVEIIYKIHGVDRPHREYCEAKDIPEKVTHIQWQF